MDRDVASAIAAIGDVVSPRDARRLARDLRRRARGAPVQRRRAHPRRRLRPARAPTPRPVRGSRVARSAGDPLRPRRRLRARRQVDAGHAAQRERRPVGVPVGHGRGDHELPPGARASLARGRAGRRRRGGVAARERRRARRRPRAHRAGRLFGGGHAHRELRGTDAAASGRRARRPRPGAVVGRVRPAVLRRRGRARPVLRRSLGWEAASPLAGMVARSCLLVAVAEHDPAVSHQQAAIAFSALYERGGRVPLVYVAGHNHFTEVFHLKRTTPARRQIAAFVQAHAPSASAPGALGGWRCAGASGRPSVPIRVSGDRRRDALAGFARLPATVLLWSQGDTGAGHFTPTPRSPGTRAGPCLVFYFICCAHW